jgi:predicted nicotinamide N-methyase
MHSPSDFGYRVWKTSWLLIDYLKQTGLPDHLNVLEIGCGWGLPGIFCARNFQAVVTCLDMDSEVFPFLQLHARVNLSQITTINSGFEYLTPDFLSRIDLLIGAEICYWDDLAGQLADLVGSALVSGVRLIVIADPGRPPFDILEEFCRRQYHSRAVTWRIHHPYQFQGRILRIGAIGRG